MKKYFYAEGSDQNGPFTLEELKEKNISKETLVWHEGLEEWKPAGQVSEVESLFTLSPPPFSPQAISPVAEESVKKPPIIEEPVKKQLNNPPKTWLVESILVTLFCCLPFGIAGIVNASKVESRYYAGDEDEAQRASRNAKKWTSVGFWCGLIGTILYGLLIVLAEL